MPWVTIEQLNAVGPSGSLQFSENGALTLSSTVVTDAPVQPGASGTHITVMLIVPLSERGGVPLSVPV